MRALICHQHGGPEVLTVGELAEPTLEPGSVLIEVAFAGVSFVDLLMIGNRHQNKHPLPFAPGMEITGHIKALGEGVDDQRLRVGQAVAALTYDGGWAQLATAAAREVFPLPSTMDLATAAGMLSTYLTSHLALSDAAKLRADQTLVVAGAAGGVGLAAVDLGRRTGANVIGIASNEKKRNLVKSYGATALATNPETLRDELLELCRPHAVDDISAGADVVLDPVAGPLYQPMFRALGWGGRYLVIGFAGGDIPRIPANHLLVKQRSAIGFVLMTYRRYRPALLQQAAQELFEWSASGALNPLVGEPEPLSGGASLLQRIADRKVIGKSVLAI